MIPRLLALKSAVPPHILDQCAVSVRAAELFQKQRDISRLMPVFENTGIERRYSCVPIDWYAESHGWVDRTNLYVENAVALLSKVTEDLLDEAKLRRDDIDAIVVSSTTGVATPSLDALVVEKLGPVAPQAVVQLPRFTVEQENTDDLVALRRNRRLN